MNNNDNYYYKILLSYEIPVNVLDDQDPNRVKAREILYSRLKDVVKNEKYETFSVKLLLHQLKDTLNYIVTYEVFFRSSGLPMNEYVGAEKVKESAKEEIENFFNSLDCDYKQLNIQPLLWVVLTRILKRKVQKL